MLEKKVKLDFENFLKKGFNKRGEEIISIKRVQTSGNISFIIQTNKSNYFLRLSGERARSRTKEEVQAEIELLKILARENLPVPIPIEINEKEVLSTNIGNGICYKILEGEIIEDFDREISLLVGKTLGKIHNITKNLNFLYERKSWGLETTKKKFVEIKEEIKNISKLEQYNFAEKFERELEEIHFSNRLPKGLIHEDFCKRHILFNNREVSGIIDWDRSYEGFFILDLGQAIRNWCFDNWNFINKEKLDLILEGYKSERKLTFLEKFYLKKAIKFAFLERALSFAIKFLNNQKEEDLEFAIKNLELIKKV